MIQKTRCNALPTWLVIALVLGTATAAAQPAASPKSVGAGILHLNVSNLEQSLALYNGLLGMEITGKINGPMAVPGLAKEPEARMRTVVVKVPGGTFSMELIQWQDTPLKPQKLKIQDPGAIMLAVNIKDMNAMMAGVHKLGLKVLTKGGVPLPEEGRGPGASTVMVEDPDGYVIELLQGTPPNVALPTTPGPVNSVAIYVTVQDLAQTVDYYNSVFGLGMPAVDAPRATPERILKLFNDPALTPIRMTRGTFPGSELTLNFQEFAVPNRHPTRHRVQDPGGPILIINVAATDVPKVIELVPRNGGTLGSGETSEAVPAGAPFIWTRDPNGILENVSIKGALAAPRPLNTP